MSKKRNLIFLSLLILGVFLISGCWLIPTPKYTVTYDGNGSTGGSIPTDSTVYKENDTVTVLDKGDLVNTGYAFAGWNTQADGSGAVQTEGSTFTMGAADVTLYAQWTINTYTVTFNSQGGSAVSSQMVEHGGLVSKPKDPTREGYTFKGWYKESSCINAWNFSNDTVTSNITLYAKWTAKSYTVSLSVSPSGSGTTTGSGTYHKGDLVTITAIANSGYTFINWTDDDSAGGPVSMDNPYTFFMVAQDINCTANFQK